MTEQALQPLEPMKAVITAVQDILEVRQTWVTGKAQELAQVEQAVRELKAAKAGEGRVRRAERRVALLRKVVKALQAGYIPIPRFNINGQAFSIEEMPLKAIAAYNEAQQSGVFDEIMAVTGRQARRRGWGREHQRDPLIVGIVEVPAVTVLRSDTDSKGLPIQFRVEVEPPHEEQFLIAWWRPEDLRPEEVY